MSLKYNPLANKGFQWLDSANDYPQISDELRYKTNVATYLSGFYCLAHARRDLIPLAMVFTKATALTHLSLPPQDNLHDPSNEWCLFFLSNITDMILESGEELYTLTTDGVSENLLVNLSRARLHLEDTKCSGYKNMIDCMGLSEQWDIALSMVSRLTSLAMLVSANAQVYSNDVSGQITLGGAVSATRSITGENFNHVPYQVASVYDKLSSSDMESVWKAMVDGLCMVGGEVSLPEPLKDDKPRDRMLRRLSNRNPSGKMRDDMLRVESQTADEAINYLLGTMSKHGFQIDKGSLSDSLLYALDYSRNMMSDFEFITFMPDVALQGLRETGHTVTMWELADREDFKSSWHHKFSDEPLHGRSVADSRLYGEKGRYLTYGVLSSLGLVDQIETLGSMYGENAVTWKKQVAMPHTTICLNDSQTSPFVLEATTKVMEKMITCLMTPRILGLGRNNALTLLVSEALVGVPVFPNFIEVQIHDSMSYGDTVDVRKVV